MGVPGRGPGGDETPEEYWQLLAQGRDAIAPFPHERWGVESLYDPDPVTAGKTYCRHGGFLRGIDQFDASFFSITPREAVAMDPQQRLVLETVWEAIESAQLLPAQLSHSQTGVYLGSMGSDYLLHSAAATTLQELDGYCGTGQASSVYASHMHAPRPGQAMHVVLVDNGRSTQLGRADFWGSLKCIRCAACLNTCPVYRRSGGYSYGSTVPGPIGSVLTPGLDLQKYAALPFASTLCGSCSAVCPVKIDLDAQLYRWRQQVVAAGHVSPAKGWFMRRLGDVLAEPEVLQLAGSIVRVALRVLPRTLARRLAGTWGATRALPDAPAGSFRAWRRAHLPGEP